MTCLQPRRSPILALAVIFHAASVPLHREANVASPRAGLLQASTNKTKDPALGIPFFTEDAIRIAEMPPFPHQKHRRACEPQCKYTCGHSECDQACDPVCLPPKCETLCTKSVETCATRCAKPKCAVICPNVECVEKGRCPKCRSVCAPPACTTSCSDNCHTVCAQPRCDWNCRLDPAKCPKPECKMQCNELQPCNEHALSNFTKVPRMMGMDIKSESTASLDPSVLNTPPVIEQKGERIMPTNSYQEKYTPPAAAPTISPVKVLKMQWEARDMVQDNARLLRR